MFLLCFCFLYFRFLNAYTGLHHVFKQKRYLDVQKESVKRFQNNCNIDNDFCCMYPNHNEVHKSEFPLLIFFQQLSIWVKLVVNMLAVRETGP